MHWISDTMKIYLIGMPGSGKSTLGIELAARLNTLFIDLDKEIEMEAGKSIRDIFKEDGERAFREIESALLNKRAVSSEAFVMSTGGGAPCYHAGIEVMNKTGISIYLKISKKELLQRLQDTEDTRPLLDQGRPLPERINNLLSERDSIYHQAQIVLESDNIDVGDLVAVISRN